MLAGIFATAFVAAVAAQEADSPLQLEAPEAWSGETIALPPGFAPKMKIRGIEVIRFAPGMFKAASESFFSYIFVFRIDGGPELTEAVVRDEILVYYRGLAAAVLGADKVDVEKFALELKQVKTVTPGATASAGKLQWIEPFVTKKPQTLRLEIQTWSAKKYRYLLCSVSPTGPTAAIWKALHEIRDTFLEANGQVVKGGNWSSFRGPRASGVADGQNLPDTWSGEKGSNIRWKARIPGLAHSSPVIWGKRLFVTTAVSSRQDADFRPGLYGAGDASKDRSPHRWILYCLDTASGKVLWERVATKGQPKDKRHIKATYANSTSATDGRYVAAFFGSEGLFVYTVAGERMWSKDLGRLDAGAYDLPEYEWGTASSPIIYRDLVLVQCDTQGESFILAADIKTGDTVWKTDRDELPSWGTPTLCEGPGGVELVTNASNFIRGYDPLTGTELWRLGGSSKITAPTPVSEDGIIVVASGRQPESPIFAVRAGARGDLSLGDGASSSEHVVWSKVRRGPYMPTPIIYRGLVYILHNRGLFDCYDLKSGEEVYRQRVPHAGSGFSGSPVAADGKIYLPSEDGDIFVVKAGREFELIAKNSMGELLMATPALSDGALYIRTQGHVFAVGR